jgi:hypothetical protein
MVKYAIMFLLFAASAMAQCWTCDAWSACTDMGFMVRTCTESAECAPPTEKPIEIKRCDDPLEYPVEPVAATGMLSAEPVVRPNPYIGIAIMLGFIVFGAVVGRMLRH